MPEQAWHVRTKGPSFTLIQTIRAPSRKQAVQSQVNRHSRLSDYNQVSLIGARSTFVPVPVDEDEHEYFYWCDWNSCDDNAEDECDPFECEWVTWERAKIKQ